MNFSKLNYILIPSSEKDREKFRNSRSGAFFRFMIRVLFCFSREGHILLFFWTLSTAASINVGFTQYYVVWSVLTGLLLGSLLVRRSMKLNDVEFRFEGSPRVTQGDEVHLDLVFKNHGNQTHQAIRIERPFLPWDGKYSGAKPFIKHLPSKQSKVTSFMAQFDARGEHTLDPVSARALTPFGLGLGPPIYSKALKFLVIPKIANVTEIKVDVSEKYQPGGVALASITGESRELIGVRAYRPGDPIRDIHAKTWARTGQPVVREYHQEYFTRIGIIIDTDGGLSDEPDFEAMLSLAAGIVAQLSRGEALLDLLVIGDHLHQLTLGRSLGFLEQALDLLAMVHIESKTQIPFAERQAALGNHLSRLSSVIFLGQHWDEERQNFSSWIEGQGIRCKKILIHSKEKDLYAEQFGVLQLKAEDIESKKELVL